MNFAGLLSQRTEVYGMPQCLGVEGRERANPVSKSGEKYGKLRPPDHLAALLQFRGSFELHQDSIDSEDFPIFCQIDMDRKIQLGRLPITTKPLDACNVDVAACGSKPVFSPRIKGRLEAFDDLAVLTEAVKVKGKSFASWDNGVIQM